MMGHGLNAAEAAEELNVLRGRLAEMEAQQHALRAAQAQAEEDEAQRLADGYPEGAAHARGEAHAAVLSLRGLGSAIRKLQDRIDRVEVLLQRREEESGAADERFRDGLGGLEEAMGAYFAVLAGFLDQHPASQLVARFHEVDAAEREAEALAGRRRVAGGAVEALVRRNGALATIVTALAEFELWVAAAREVESPELSMNR